MGEIREGIHFIPGQDEMIPDSHTYVVGKLTSKDLSLIDPGLTGKGRYKIQTIRQMGIDLTHIKRIIMTHTHFDHIGCLPEIQKQLPGAELWIHVMEAEPLERGDERTVYGMDMFRSLCQMQYGLKAGSFSFRADRRLQGGESLDLGGMTWEVIHIPGHSVGSIGLYQPVEKILIPGDVVYAGHAIGRWDLYGADAKELRKSLMRLAEKEVHVLLPGHDEIVERVPPGYIRKTVKEWESYLT